MLDTAGRSSMDGHSLCSYEQQWYHYTSRGAWTSPRFDGGNRSLFVKVIEGALVVFLCLDSDVAVNLETTYDNQAWVSFLLTKESVLYIYRSFFFFFTD